MARSDVLRELRGDCQDSQLMDGGAFLMFDDLTDDEYYNDLLIWGDA